MPVTDRTNEFRACVESIRNRSSIPNREAQDKQRVPNGTGKPSKSEFARMASAIGKDITNTTTKLDKLAQCMWYNPRDNRMDSNAFFRLVAKRKTLFDDRPVEISVSLPKRTHFPIGALLEFIEITGAHLHYQARYCKPQQTDRFASNIRQNSN
jgi:Syntaxin-5 N-terminal, Sly1p-binding domain